MVISPPEINDHLTTLIVAPLTRSGRPTPFRVVTTFAGKSGLLPLEPIRAVDARRLVKKVGGIDGGILSAALAVLRTLFAV